MLTTSAPSAPGVPDPLRSRLGLTNTFTTSSPSTTGNTLSSHTGLSSSGSTSTSASGQSSHPLQTRLAHWRATQEATRFAQLGRQYGLAEPIRRRMELDIVSRGEWRPAVLGNEGRSFGSPWATAPGAATGAGVHADVLMGREAEFGWEDVFVDDPLSREGGFADEVEGRVGMGRW